MYVCVHPQITCRRASKTGPVSEGWDSQGNHPGEDCPRPGPSRLGGDFKERHSRSRDIDSGAGMRQLRERKAARTRGALGPEVLWGQRHLSSSPASTAQLPVGPG